jgi:zinc D-Ala-D-Ala carboxypeptidase
MQNVSEHISYIDAIRSDTAKRNGINNYFTPSQLVNMKLLAEKVYEPLVKHFGKTIYISSFFRNTKVNKLIGGVKDSQHLADNGAAIDLDSINPTNEDIFNYIKDNLDFDQLIIEDLRPDGGVGWIHVSYKEVGNRKQVLTMVLVNGKKHYEIYK